MSVVVVERSFDEPVAFESLQAAEDSKAACLEAYGVRFKRSYFSRDRRRMICLYEAPDAESVRFLQEKAGLPFDRVWTARAFSHHEASEPYDDAVVVERELEAPLDEAGVRAAVARGAGCYELYGCRIVWTYLSQDGHRAACVYGGPDAESVRQVQRQTGVPFERAWPATVHEPK
jgi:hypothetical protein